MSIKSSGSFPWDKKHRRHNSTEPNESSVDVDFFAVRVKGQMKWRTMSNYKPVRKIAKETNSFVVSIRPSVRMEQLGSEWKDF